MSATVSRIPTLGPRLIAHLDEQAASAQRLLDLISQQGAAIRARDVDTVVKRLADIDLEMTRRQRLELERARILSTAAEELGMRSDQLGLDHIVSLLAPIEAQNVRFRSTELRTLLERVSVENGRNRALMRQELAFLDHLLRLAGQPSDPGYKPMGNPSTTNRNSVLDLRA